MITRLKWFSSLVLIGCLGLMNGCGGGGGSASTTSELSGRATQSPIVGSIVFADRIVGGVSNFIQDAGEVVAPPTDANGNYKLAVPSYTYVLVSKGGTDTITGLKQILMLAPPDSKNITPLTTLVTLETTETRAKTLIGKLEALQGGIKFDSDVYTNSSPAVLMLMKSVEISVQSLTDTFNQKSGNVLTNTEIYSIQARVMQKIAATLTNTPSDLSIPANINSVLIAAFTAAIPAVTADNTNILISASEVAGIAASAANSSVDSAALAVGRTGHADTNPLSKIAAAATAESSLASFATSFKNALTAAVSSLSSSFTIAYSSTPVVIVPPTFPVVTVPASTLTGSTGNPGTF